MRTLLFVLLAPMAMYFTLKALPIIIGVLIWYFYSQSKKAEKDAIWDDPEKW